MIPPSFRTPHLSPPLSRGYCPFPSLEEDAEILSPLILALPVAHLGPELPEVADLRDYVLHRPPLIEAALTQHEVGEVLGKPVGRGRGHGRVGGGIDGSLETGPPSNACDFKKKGERGGLCHTTFGDSATAPRSPVYDGSAQVWAGGERIAILVDLAGPYERHVPKAVKVVGQRRGLAGVGYDEAAPVFRALQCLGEVGGGELLRVLELEEAHAAVAR